MLSIMREQAGSWFIKFILGAIVIVFVFWGVGSWRSQRANRVAVVNGEVITLEEFSDAYANLIEQYRRSFGDNLNEETLRMLKLKQQAVDQLIDQRLLLAEAQRLGLKITDQELADQIAGMQAFRTANGFNRQQYQRLLSLNRLTPEKFEHLQRQTMLITRLTDTLTDSLKVSEAEARQWYDWQEAEVAIDYVRFDPATYPAPEPSQEALAAFFDENAADYKTEPAIQVRYLRLTADRYREQVEIAEEDIEAYFVDHPDEFETQKTVEARHILIKTEPDDDAAAVEAARQRAVEVLDKARAGEAFDELARQYSEGPSAPRGGQLGAFAREDMVEPFSDRAFAMEAGEISEPVKTQFGWHIIKVEKVNPATSRTLDEARGEIRGKLIDMEARNRAYGAASDIYDAAFEADDLLKLAGQYGIDVITTEFFTRQGPESDEIADRRRFAEAAFGLEMMEISDVVDLADGFYLLQAIERRESEIPPLESVREAVTADWTARQQDEQARLEARAFLDALRQGAAWNDQLDTAGLSGSTTDWFQRDAAIPGVGYERQIVTAAFSLTAAEPLPDDVLQGRQGYYVIRFNGRRAPTADGFADAREVIVDRLKQQKQGRLYEALLARLRSQSEITIEERFVE